MAARESQLAWGRHVAMARKDSTGLKGKERAMREENRITTRQQAGAVKKK